MNPTLEYITGLTSDYASSWRCLGAVIIFALIVIAVRQWRGP